MIKHIVIYTLKEGVNKPEAVEIIRSVLEPSCFESWAQVLY